MAGKGKRIGPRDAVGGYEVEAPPIQEWEKGVSTGHGTTTYTPKFQDPPRGPPGVSRGRGMTDAEIDAYKKANPSLYAKGGKVGKVNPFGLKNSRPDFASGGNQSNRKFNFKKGDI